MDKPGPMSREEVRMAIEVMEKSASEHGLWEKVCIHCGLVVGARLAEYGKPMEDSIDNTVCPDCFGSGQIQREGYRGRDHIRICFRSGRR